MIASCTPHGFSARKRWISCHNRQELHELACRVMHHVSVDAVVVGDLLSWREEEDQQ